MEAVHRLTAEAQGSVRGFLLTNDARFVTQFREARVQAGQAGQFGRARGEGRAPGGREPVPGAPGGTGARGSRVTAEQCGEPGQPCFQPGDLRAPRSPRNRPRRRPTESRWR